MGLFKRPHHPSLECFILTLDEWDVYPLSELWRSSERAVELAYAALEPGSGNVRQLNSASRLLALIDRRRNRRNLPWCLEVFV